MEGQDMRLIEEDGKCLFCRDLFESGGDGEEEADTGQNTGAWVVLNQIGSYFKNSLKKELVIVRNGRNVHCKSTNAKEFYGLLCCQCEDRAERLTQLCKELELVQMKVDYGVKEIMGLVTAGSGETLSKINLKEMHRSRLLNINVKRLPEGNTVNEQPSPATSPVPVTQPTPRAPVPASHVNCPYCSENLPLAEPKKITYHTVMQHPDQFFSTAKLYHVSCSDFETLSRNHLMAISEKTTTSHGVLHKCFYCAYAFKYRQSVVVHMVDNHYALLTDKLKSIQKSQYPSPNSGTSSPQQIPWSPSPPPRSPSLPPGSPPPQEDSNPVVEQLIYAAYTNILENSQDEIHPKVQELFLTIPFSHANIDGQPVVLCELCPTPETAAKFPVKDDQGQGHLQQHVCHQHPEFFFESLRHPTTPHVDFHKLCDSAVRSLQHSTKEGLPTQRRCTRSCTICSAQFPTTERRLLCTHVIQAHYELLTNTIQSKQNPILQTMLTTGNCKYTCKHCGVGFHSFSALGGHVAAKHSTRNKLVEGTGVKCPHCFVEVTSRSNLRRHMMRSCPKLALTKTPSTPGTPSFQATTVVIKQEHYSTSFVNDTVKKCSVCGAAFTNVFLLGRHIKLKHPNHNPSHYDRCPYCKQTFVKRNLARHKHICPFKPRDVLVVEQKTTEPKRYCCDFCDTGFPTTMGLNVHKARTHNIPMTTIPKICTYCGMKFSNTGNLSRHVKKSCRVRNPPAGEGDAAIYKEMEESATSSMSVLARSIVEIPCKFCGKSFGRRSETTRHERMHCPMRLQENAGTQEGTINQNEMGYEEETQGEMEMLDGVSFGEEFVGEEAMEIPGLEAPAPIDVAMETSTGGESMMNIDGDNLFENQMEVPFGDIVEYQLQIPGMEEDPLLM